MTSPRRLLAVFSGAAVVAALAAVPSASAALVSLSTCSNASLTQPFISWADPGYYELVKGGDFESGTWSLSGGAKRISGSEPFAVTGSLGNWSVILPAGASARSPSTCVTAAYPTIRFFVAGQGAVAIDVIDSSGNVVSAGDVAATGSWEPTPVTVTGSAIAGVVNNGSDNVSIRVTALSGNPKVDDVYIDPWRST